MNKFSELTSLKQRHCNLTYQPRKVNDLLPQHLQLITKRSKRCRECNKYVIKQNINPLSSDPLKVDQQLIFHVPKVILYRMGKWTEGSPTVEAFIKFINPNFSVYYVTLSPL